MTNKHLAFDSSLHRDVRDALAAATLCVFVGVILLVCAWTGACQNRSNQLWLRSPRRVRERQRTGL